MSREWKDTFAHLPDKDVNTPKIFMIFFVWSILSFSQLFWMQLGPYILGYSSQLLALITLLRSLFGDFDVDLVMDSSNSMINVICFLL